MTQSAEAFSQTQGTGAEATSQMPVQTEAAVRQLWGLLSAIAPSVGKEAKQVHLNFRPSAPLVPFSALGEEAIQQGNRPSDTSKLVQWVVQDRLSAAIVENPYERLGGGLYYPETQGERTNQPPHVAVKWEAHRQTRIGAAGKLIHRLRFDLEVQGQPVTCIVTAQRPQLLVHFATDHVPLLTHLRRGEHMVTAPLAATGWELVSWTAGLASQEGEGSEWQPNEQ